ncbi:hypothetical protein DVA67_017535 [Solirubrobacter sp. CPCC 204708]|nr:hypothetical protein [Solirubrobacter deserti]
MIATQAALIALLVVAASAQAGTMHVYSCHTPTGTPVGVHGWSHTAGLDRGQAFSDCENGPYGALYVRAGGRPLPETVSWAFSAVADTSIIGFAAAACLRSFTVDSGPIGVAGLGWPNALPLRSAQGGPWTSKGEVGCHGGSSYWADVRNTFQRSVPPVPSVHFTAACLVQCSLPVQASVEIASFRADIRDDQAPLVSQVRGALASNLSHAGRESVDFDVSDRGVGAYRAVVEARLLGKGNWLTLSTVPIGHGRVSCRELDVTAHPYEFDHPQPCPLTLSGARVEFETDSLPQGEHDFRVTVEDASGNRTPVITARKFLAKEPPGSATPALTAAPRNLMLRVEGAARRSLPKSEPFRLRGSLTEIDGRPLAGATLTVRSRPFVPKANLATGDWSVVGQVITGPDGRFDARIPAGDSRTVQVMREAGDGLAAVAAHADVIVPAQVTASARATRIRNGQSAVFTGRVRGPIPAGGVLVALEVREPGRWIPVATTRRWVRTNATGRFRLAYRFRRTFQPSTYRFRVVAADDSAFTYSRGVSRTIDVQVRP